MEFKSIPREEYKNLYSFIESKKLRISNLKKQAVEAMEDDEFLGSDEQDLADDPYLQRERAEGQASGQVAISGADLGDSDSDDEDFDAEAENMRFVIVCHFTSLIFCLWGIFGAALFVAFLCFFLSLYLLEIIVYSLFSSSFFRPFSDLFPISLRC